MKKICSLLLACIMLLSVSAFAAEIAWETEATFTVTPSAKEVAVGENFTVSVGVTFDDVTGDSVDLLGGYNMQFELYYDSTAFEFVAPATYNYGQTIADATQNALGAGGLNYNVDVASGDLTVLEATPFAVYTFRVLESATAGENYSFTLNNCVLLECGGKNYGEAMTTAGSSDVTVKAGGGEEEEEVFGIEDTASALEGSEMMKDATGEKVAATGDKVVAIFAKNVTSETLAAESYGIIFGGKRFPGIAPVDPGKAWAVKLVGSSTQLPAGNYEYGVYAGGAEVMSDEAWVVE